jgi:hypothetical protein
VVSDHDQRPELTLRLDRAISVHESEMGRWSSSATRPHGSSGGFEEVSWNVRTEDVPLVVELRDAGPGVTVRR